MSSLLHGPYCGAVAPACLSKIWPLHIAARVWRSPDYMNTFANFQKRPQTGLLQLTLVRDADYKVSGAGG